MDITENERALKKVAYIISAAWLITTAAMLSPLHLSFLGYILLACHITAAITAYLIIDIRGETAAGWVIATLCCPAVFPILIREDVDNRTLIEGTASAIVFISGSIIIRFFPKEIQPFTMTVIIAVLISYIAIVIYAARIAAAHFRSAPLWGVGCAVLPPLLIVLIIMETDFERMPGGKILILFGSVLLVIFTPLIWIFRKIGYAVSSLFEKIFPGGYSDTGTSTVSKSCSGCGKPVSTASMAGGRCPHCGVYWSFETTEKKRF